ncbi:polysaccharide pyruvyl transferase family protein [Microbulbifer sp. JMSA008]|uniref:polysaccharide pyruvyl transferase family protein n=1 Tax=Microbulbifer sp. JMSA008 TaxID=3243373 RepID=UPI0040398481
MKKLRVGFLAPNIGSVAESFSMTAQQVMANTGQNTGNLAFWFSARRLFDHDVVPFRWNENPQKLRQKIDLIFIPAANFLSEQNDLSILANLIKECDLPCLIFGLGAQSESENIIPKLKSGTVDFLNEVSSRTPFIGVRGDFTEKVCRRYGVDNVKVVGCPSIFINGDRELGFRLEKRFLEPISKVVVHAACLKEQIREVEREFVRYVKLYNGKYILQRPPELIQILNREVLTASQEEYTKKFAKFCYPDLDYGEFLQEIRRSALYFTDANAWLAYLKTYSHAIGSRIHGTILPLSSGVPSVCITHDTRTRELSKKLMVPNLSSEEFLRVRCSLRDIFSSVKFKGDDFEDNRTTIAKDYNSIFQAVGLIRSKHFSNF